MVQTKRITQLRSYCHFPDIICEFDVHNIINLFLQFWNTRHLFLCDNLTSIIRIRETKSCNILIHKNLHHLFLNCATTVICITIFMHCFNHRFRKSCFLHLIVKYLDSHTFDSCESILLRLLTLFRHKSHHGVCRSHFQRILRLYFFRNCQSNTTIELEHIKNITRCEMFPNYRICSINLLRMKIFII